MPLLSSSNAWTFFCCKSELVELLSSTFWSFWLYKLRMLIAVSIFLFFLACCPLYKFPHGQIMMECCWLMRFSVNTCSFSRLMATKNLSGWSSSWRHCFITDRKGMWSNWDIMEAAWNIFDWIASCLALCRQALLFELRDSNAHTISVLVFLLI